MFCLTVKTHCNDEPKLAASESRKLKGTGMEMLPVFAQLTSNCIYNKDITNNHPKRTLFCDSIKHKSSCVEANCYSLDARCSLNAPTRQMYVTVDTNVSLTKIKQ